jgi:hypothetical protein
MRDRLSKLAKVAGILLLASILAAVVIVYTHVRPGLIEF